MNAAKSENAPKYSHAFKITRDSEADATMICFELGDDGKPIKIGDGSFGAVYRGRRGRTGANVAIKVLYDNSGLRPRRLSEIGPEEKQILAERLAEKHGLKPESLGPLFQDTTSTDFALLKQLQRVEAGAGGEPGPGSTARLVEFLDELTKEASSSAVYRFQSERTYTGTMLDYNGRATGIRSMPEGLVEVVGGTHQFTDWLKQAHCDPPASDCDNCGDVTAYFGDDASKVSDYVLVMDLYHYSLKDLLEGKDRDRSTGQKGYDVLRELPLDLRVREALLLLTKVAYGLSCLHNANSPDSGDPLFHRDIKPGNIFVRTGEGGRIQVDLGDLGNLPILPAVASPQANVTLPPESIDTGYARGTQHYRSPEQKYYTDVANARVMHLPAAKIKEELDRLFAPASAPSPAVAGDGDGTPAQDKPSKRVVLVVTDPKFNNTLIERSDVVILSKDTKRQQRMIDGDPIDGKEAGYLAFVLKDLPEKNPILQPDEKTQVEFYKKQEYRTDLFGIGAVVFDIVTAGWSPEKFYESIRKFETSSITNIRDQYETLRRGEIEGENLDLSEIFAPFRNNNDTVQRYPEGDIIEFILKCMLYQSEGTFFNQNRQEPSAASVQLYNEMQALCDKYVNKHHAALADRSILVHKRTPPKQSGSTPIQFDVQIAKLQGIEPWPEVAAMADPALIAANRLLRGTYYFVKMVDLVRTIVDSNQDEVQRPQGAAEPPSAEHISPYLRHILPTYVSFEEDRLNVALAFDPAPSWASRETLLRDVRQNRLEQFVRTSQNPFVPNQVAGMRRIIRLFPKAQEDIEHAAEHAAEPGVFSYVYRFRDASPFGIRVNAGDWIVCNNTLWEVVASSGADELQVRLLPPDQADDTKTSILAAGDRPAPTTRPVEFLDGYYFSALAPFKYYLDVLAMYLLHLVFVYSPLTTTTRDRLDIRRLLGAFEIDPAWHTVNICGPVQGTQQGDCCRSELGLLHTNLVYLLLKLTLHESPDSYYAQMMNLSVRGGLSSDAARREVLTSINNFVVEQYDRIWAMLVQGLLRSGDRPPLITAFGAQGAGRQEFEDLVEDRFDIEKAIKRCGLIMWQK